MASFTDKAPEFNPYVGTQPIEAMVKVGMHKQQKYDEGVQKIQESYNKIAGLDIMKEGDRSYLQQKLSDTTAKLRTFAAGDFSNSQLTNSVTGMITGLSKDETVRNSVFATAKVRREMRTAEEAQKSGKSSVVNQWALQEEVGEWLNDGQVGSYFTGKYTPFTDVDKKLRDVYDKMGDTETQTDNPFIRDARGNTIYFSPDGKKSSTTPQEGWKSEVDHAMLRTLTKGKTSSKILENFKASLSEDDVNQLALNAKYHYRNADVDFLKEEFSKRVQSKKAIYKKTISDINLELDTNKDLSQAEEEVLRSNLKKYASALEDGEIEKELQDGLEKLNDPANQENFKYRIYTDNYLNDLSEAMENLSIKHTYETNPYFKAQMDLKNLKFKYDDARRQQANADRLYAFKREELAWKKEEKLKETNKENEIYVTDGDISTEDSEGKFTTLGLEKELTELVGTDEEIASKGYGGAGALGQLNSQYFHTLGNEMDQQQKIQHFNKLAEEYKRNPNGIKYIDNPDVKDYLQRRYALDVTIARKQNLYHKTKTHEESVVFDKALDAALKSMKPVATPDGAQYSARDVLDFNAKVKSLYTLSSVRTAYGGVGSSTGVVKQLDVDKLREAFKGTRYEPLANSYAKMHIPGQPDLSHDERTFLTSVRDLTEDAVESAGKIRNAQEVWREAYIRKHSPEAQTQVGVIPTTNKKYISAAKAFVQNSINRINNGVGEMDNYKRGQFDPVSAAAALSDAQAGYVITKAWDGSAVLEIQSKGTTNRMPLTNAQLIEYFPSVSKSNPMNTAKQLIESSPIHSTNLKASNAPDAAISAYFNGTQIPKIAGNKYLENRVRMDIIGKSYNDGGPQDQYYLRLYYLDDSDGWITDTTRTYKSLAATQADIYSIDESTIFDMLVQNKKNKNK